MISVTILTKNNAKTLKNCLNSLQEFEEVIVLDNGSEDETIEIAKSFSNVKVSTSPFIGFGPLHNKATALAKNDWILSIDSDEVLSKEASEEIRSMKLDEGSVYRISSHNFFNEKRIKGCGWSPDYKLRLYNRQKTAFSEDLVHESVITKGLQVKTLRHPIYHYSYETIEDFLKKKQIYSSLFAKQHQGKRRSSFLKAYLKGKAAFFRAYILKKGFLDGKEGYFISRYYADTAFYKYMKLALANQEWEKKKSI